MKVQREGKEETMDQSRPTPLGATKGTKESRYLLKEMFEGRCIAGRAKQVNEARPIAA